MRYFISALLVIGSFSINAQTLYSGDWDADSYFTTFEGSWKVVKEGDKTYVVMGDDFKTKKAPDLKIFLTKADLGDIDGDNAAEGTSVFVAKLKSYKGAAKYLIPSNINVSDYKTIIVHCEQYSKFWGGSPLK
ncbi:MAG: DM13 domain-containing protein [Bacteroidota bacterium]